jgi:hypothetical protein
MSAGRASELTFWYQAAGPQSIVAAGAVEQAFEPPGHEPQGVAPASGNRTGPAHGVKRTA